MTSPKLDRWNNGDWPETTGDDIRASITQNGRSVIRFAGYHVTTFKDSSEFDLWITQRGGDHDLRLWVHS